MDIESAKQFLIDFSERPQPEDRVQAFREWQQNASPGELAALDQWHQEWLPGRRGKVLADQEMLDRNRQWLEDRIDGISEQEEALADGEKSLHRRPGLIRIMGRLIAAAVIIGVVGVGVYFFISTRSAQSVPRVAQPGTVFTTARGQSLQVVLPDGSHVWLNSASSITYTSSSNSRSVTLIGEAYFSIRRDPVLPFVVRTRNMDVQVLGTQFNVAAYADEPTVRATLVNGAVAISREKNKTLLNPNEQADVRNGTDTIRVTKPDMEEVLAWRKDEYRFKKADIQPIMRQLSRWFDVKVTYEGAVSTSHFSGVMSRRQDFRQLLEALEISGNIHFIVSGNEISVLSGPNPGHQ